MSRRDFITGAAGAGVGFGLGMFSHRFPLPSPQTGPAWQPGRETFVNSTCMLCPAHCGIRVRGVDGRPSRIDGNPLHPVSQGGLCPKGRAGIQLLYHPGRFTGPVERVGPPGSDEFRSISWENALDRVETALRSSRARSEGEAAAWLVGHAHGVMGRLISAFREGYGSCRIAVDDYRDGSAEVLRLCQGIDAPPAFDLEASDMVLSFGAGLAEAWWGLPQASRARGRERSARWVQVDTRLSRTAAGADEWVPVRPGTYGALALGLAYFILKEGLYDADRLSRHTSGWEDWTDESGTVQVGLRRLILRHGRPDFVSVRTGVPVPKLVALAKSFATASTPVAIWDQVVSWRAGGLADALAIHALNILCGRLNEPGGVLVQPPLGLPGPGSGLSGEAAVHTSWPQSPGDEHSVPDVLFLYRSNPVASAPSTERVAEAIARVPLVVSFSPFRDESARHADLVLPDHTDLERWQDARAPASVAYPVWGVVQPATEPLHDTRATGDVVLELAKRLGDGFSEMTRWSSVEQIVRERGTWLASEARGSAFVKSFRRRELREIESRGWWLPHEQSSEKYWEEIRSTGGWFDPFYDYHDRSGASQNDDGRVWVFPGEARRRLQTSGLPLAEGFMPNTEDTRAEHGDAGSEFPLRLSPYRVLTLASGGTALMPWLLEGLGVLTGDAWEVWAEVHPGTASDLGLRAGQHVRVESEHGSFEAKLRPFAGTQPGVVSVPYGLHTRIAGWLQPRGANPLRAVGDRVDPVTHLPDWYGTRVRVTPA